MLSQRNHAMQQLFFSVKSLPTRFTKSSQASKAMLQSSKHTSAKHNAKWPFKRGGICIYCHIGDSYCQLSVHQRAAMQQLSVKIFKLSFEYLPVSFIVQKVAIFAEKNSKIASLMPYQRSDLRKTWKYSHSRDLEGIHEYFEYIQTPPSYERSVVFPRIPNILRITVHYSTSRTLPLVTPYKQTLQ